MGNELLNQERYADFCAELNRRLIATNVDTLMYSGRHQKVGKEQDAVWAYVELSMDKSLREVNDTKKSEEAGKSLPGLVSYETVLALCAKAIETGEVEIANGGYTQERRKRQRVDRDMYPRQTVVVAFVHEGRLYCGFAMVSANTSVSLSPFGANRKRPDKKAVMAHSRRCISVEL